MVSHVQYFELNEDQVPVILVQTSTSQKYLNANIETDEIAPWLKEYMVSFNSFIIIYFFFFFGQNVVFVIYFLSSSLT